METDNRESNPELNNDGPDRLEKLAPTASAPAHLFAELRHSPEEIRDLFRRGKYPYKRKIKKSAYEAHKEELQVELLKVQNWVKQSGQRIVALFEGRDAAGKGGTIKRFMELEPEGSACCGS